MESSPHRPADLVLTTKEAQNGSDLFSSEAVLNILRLIFSGAPLAQVLTIIAQLVECRDDGTLCSIWVPTDDGRQLYCVAAPSIPGFIDGVGAMLIGPKGGSCGTAVYRREPVYVTDVLTDPVWDIYRERLVPFGIRAVWSQPLFTSARKILGTFAIHYREARSPDAIDLELIENFSHITGIAIERHINEQRLRLERDRLRLLLEITNSMASRLDMRRLVETLSTDLLRVTRCDFCALLLPDSDSMGLRVTTLYNPETRGSLCGGTIVPIDDSICGKAFRTGET
jgi:formate hydrogenlyase transcriptional activator